MIVKKANNVLKEEYSILDQKYKLSLKEISKLQNATRLKQLTLKDGDAAILKTELNRKAETDFSEMVNALKSER